MEVLLNNKYNDEYVYDISLDGTFVNALGCNVVHNTDGFNFKMPDKFRYTEENPYIGKGLGRNVMEGKKYVGVFADIAEFEDLFMKDAYNDGINKMGLGLDEVVPSSINFSRKNYADLLDDGSTKKVGNTIKSRRMSTYIEKFVDEGIDLLLNGKGYNFLEKYYSYIDKIYNYRIPLREIASKGKIKKTIEQYKKDCETLTKSGSKKSRQAWYELVIRENIKVDLNDTIYYVNCGSKKSESDVKRITHQYVKRDGEIIELDNKLTKIIVKEELGIDDITYRSLTTKQIKDIIKKHIIKEDDEIILNCKLIPQNIIDSEDDVLCNDDIEYNVVKYIEQFNSRIKPLLVCFSKEIRDEILIQNPDDRKYFTEEQCKLSSGEPTKDSDQDTFEQLMSIEKKEMDFWLSINETPPFVKECDIDWDKCVKEYLENKKMEEDIIFQEENDKYLKILSSLTENDIEKFEDEGIIPKSLSDIVSLDSNMVFKFIKLPNLSPSTGGYIFDDIKLSDNSENEYENYISENNY